MQRIKLLTGLLFLWLALPAQQFDGFRPMDQSRELKERIRRVSRETKSIRSDFTQEKHLTMLEEVLVSDGRFLFRQPNDVRWEYLAPISYTIVIFNGQFTIRDGEKISEFDLESNAMFKQVNNMIVTAIRGDFVDNPEFSPAFFESDKQYLVRLKPLDEQVAGMLSEIAIFFNKQDLAVEELIFTEPGEDFTKITFRNRRVNIPIDDRQFQLRP